jgi:hypothetical protein
MSREQNSLNSLLFRPGISRNKKDSSPVRELTIFDAESSTSSVTGSFRFDSPGAPIKSTQQLNVDFSKFQNHTFFGSAQAKVQKSFDKIINGYPFDGSKSEVDEFRDSLTGFEKYVLDEFPKSIGYLHFSGSYGSQITDGTYITVKDFNGSFSPTLSKNPTGKSVLDFATGPFTAEFFINVPSGTVNENSIILQKVNGNEGLTICLSGSHDMSSPLGQSTILTILSSGSQSLTSSMTIPKGSFQHCAIVFDKKDNPGRLNLYRNGKISSQSSFCNFGQINFVTSPITIGSGTSVSTNSYSFTPVSTLSGSIDELRFWHKSKNQSEVYSEMNKNVFADENLKLYYTFNEPSGTFSRDGSNLVLDHSGNGLHARISNFSSVLRSYIDGNPPLTSEDSQFSPVLFPSYQDVSDFSQLLISSASDYDYNNPNLVTKLIPSHYFQEAQFDEGFESEDGNIGNTIGVTTDQPGGGKIGQAQIISSLLYTMSETFDEIKMLIDEFRRLLKVDYVTNETVSDQLLPWLSSYYGIKLPDLFSSANLSQFKDGQNVTLGGKGTTNLQTIQNALWRRVFADLPKTMSTRGTRESLNSALRNFGISSNGPVRIRELGGSKSLTLGDSFVRRNEVAAMLDFSGSINPVGATNSLGFYDNLPHIASSYLLGTRTEPGVPEIQGVFVSGVSSNPSDGLFTSGSWTYEGTYKFSKSLKHSSPQSLVRMLSTGSLVSSGGLFYNLLAFPEDILTSATGSLKLYGSVSTGSNSPLIVLNLTGVNVFDGNKWNISFGRERNDMINSHVSSSYFIRAGKFTPGGLEEFSSVSSYFSEVGNEGVSSNFLQNLDPSHNASGTFLAIGRQNIDTSASTFLNTSSIDSEARSSYFSGKVSGIRFWSKALTEKESKIHTRNFKSLGVENPDYNFNFISNVPGSFEKVRLDVSIDQIVTKSNSTGDVLLFDYSQNQKTFSGSGFQESTEVIKPERFDFDVLSSDFKSGENPNKIRIRSFLDSKNIDVYETARAPLHVLPQNEEPKDDKRIQIEISATQALNEDIMNIFATLDFLDNAIGSPELVFAQEYPSLRHLRRVYFNRLSDKLNLTTFFQFFKWFDESLGDYLDQLLPNDSKFLGTSYVIEPHALERSKFVYNYYDMYLGEENRGGKSILYLQQIEGTLRKI